MFLKVLNEMRKEIDKEMKDNIFLKKDKIPNPFLGVCMKYLLGAVDEIDSRLEKLEKASK